MPLHIAGLWVRHPTAIDDGELVEHLVYVRAEPHRPLEITHAVRRVGGVWMGFAGEELMRRLDSDDVIRVLSLASWKLDAVARATRAA